MVGTGANRTPLTKVHPILLGQKKSEGDSILARHRQQHQERLQQQTRPDGPPSGWGPNQGHAPPFSTNYFPPSYDQHQPPLPGHFQPPIPGMPPSSYGGPPPPPPMDFEEKGRRKRSRWGDPEDKSMLGVPSALPASMTEEQRKHFLLHFKIEEITQKLRTGELGIPSDPTERSPSPEPIYNSEGKRLNTREFRVRKKLEEERHALIKQAIDEIPSYKPPADYKPPPVRVHEKVFIPQDKNPAINFIGLLIGPRGNTLKKMEKETGCKIIIRGKGSVKEGKVGRIAGQPMPGEDEPLHAMVTGPTEKDVKHAVEVIRKIVKEGLECPDAANELRRNQLRELAALNGTLIEEDLIKCKNCGALDHRHWECQEQKNVTSQIVCNKCGGYGHVASDCKVLPGESGMQLQQTFAEKAKMDNEYLSLMAELGVDTPPPPKKPFDAPVPTSLPPPPTEAVGKVVASSDRFNFNQRPTDAAGVAQQQNKWGPPANMGGQGPRLSMDIGGHGLSQHPGGQAPAWTNQGAQGSGPPRNAMMGQGGLPPWQQGQQRGLAPGLPNPRVPHAGFQASANGPIGYPGQAPFGGAAMPWQQQGAPVPSAVTNTTLVAYPQTWNHGLARALPIQGGQPGFGVNYAAFGHPAPGYGAPLHGNLPPWAQQPPPPPPPPPSS